MQECLPFALGKREEGHDYVFASCRKLLLHRRLLQRLQRVGSWREPGLRAHVRPPPGPCVLSVTSSVTAAVGDAEMDKTPPRPPRSCLLLGIPQVTVLRPHPSPPFLSPRSPLVQPEDRCWKGAALNPKGGPGFGLGSVTGMLEAGGLRTVPRRDHTRGSVHCHPHAPPCRAQGAK